MKKKIISKLYFLLILAIPFTCVYVIFQKSSSQEIICFINEINGEVTEDEGLTDSNEIHFDSLGSGIINSKVHFNFNFLNNSLSTISYFFNIHEIYLGLSPPPPKSLFT